MNGVAKENTGIGYKVFNPDWTCKDFQYEVGKEYVHEGEIAWCRSGFHFCPTLVDCFNYYTWNCDNKVAIVHYDITKSIHPEGEDKVVTSHIRIEKEIAWEDVMRMCNLGVFNTGHQNSGDRNSGDWNSGHRNSGDWNSGDRNSGHRNSGDWNSGDWNSGHQNSGHQNSGHQNSGHQNSGDRNSGDWNSGDWNSGHFNSSTPADILVFNQPCKKGDWDECDKPAFIYFDLVELVVESNMTDDEKTQHPNSAITGGYLKVMPYKEAFQKSYNAASEEDRARIKNIPNFDADVFFEISGIRVK